ncbi:MAG: hypothetical protein SGJ27_18155 [Candidatus Melainabacteria bacterium]|nr:hypothetical protein [Candidatus Melainabacteria bacterium]
MATQKDICKYLRAKNGYGTLEGGGMPFLQDSITTTYRCICTGEPFGPDTELAHTSACHSERYCFAAPNSDPETED